MEQDITKTTLIDRKRAELKQLKRLRAHVPVLKITVGLSDHSLNDIESRINQKIMQCEHIIYGDTNK